MGNVIPIRPYGDPTVKFIFGLLTPDRDAVIKVYPGVKAVAKPAAEMVDTLIFELVQVTWEVMLAVEPSEYVPTAINCWVEPTGKLSHENRSMLIEDTNGADVVVRVIDVAASTGKLAAGLVTPNRTALILAVPVAMPVALPVESIVTVPVVSMTQATRAVISPVEPSEYVPVAVNCAVAPTAKLGGEAGSTSIEDNFGPVAAASTVKLIVGLVMPDLVAVILAVPAATPVALPAASIVAIPVVALAQVT